MGLEVDARALLDGLSQGEALPGGREVQHRVAVGHLEATQGLLGYIGHHLLHQLHDVLVIGIGLVGLQKGVLRVVLGGDALVAEDGPNLVDAVEAADDEALEVQLGGDAQIEVAVERVVVGDEGLGGGAPGRGLEDGRFDLQEAPLVQEVADGGDDAAAQAEDVAHGGVGHEVEVALAIAHLHVLKAVPLLGRGAQGLGQEGVLAGLHCDLAAASTEERAGHAHEVADVYQVHERLVAFVAQDILAEVGLDLACAIAQVDEGALAHEAHGGDPAGQANLDRFLGGGALLLQRLEGLHRLLGRVGTLAAGGIGVAAASTQALQLGLPLLDKLLASVAHVSLPVESEKISQRQMYPWHKRGGWVIC